MGLALAGSQNHLQSEVDRCMLLSSPSRAAWFDRGLGVEGGQAPMRLGVITPGAALTTST
ncbi:MAG: hypothetical protein ACRDH5_08865 [bacterium]